MSVTVDMTITERQFNQLRSLIESRFGIQLPEEKRSLLQARLQKMVRASGMDNFADYYDSRLRNPELRVLSELVDNISTNHTYFWRENAHFTWFRDTWIPAAMQRHQRDRDLRVWCAAASTGQEPYTIAALLRDAVSVRPEPWTAGLLATDISQRVLDFARKGSYERDDVERLPGELVSRHFEADGPGRMKVRNKTRQDVTYRRLNLLSPSLPFTPPLRGHLPQERHDLLRSADEAAAALSPGPPPRARRRCVHRDVRVDAGATGALPPGASRAVQANSVSRPIRVLVVDDSTVARAVLTRGLAADPMIHVVGAARDAYEARDLIVYERPDVVTLDVEMPRMDGVEFLSRLMPQFPVPVVMVSSLTQRGQQVTLDALAAGAVDVVAKPSRNMSQGIDRMMVELRTKVKIAAGANVAHYKRSVPPRRVKTAATSTDKVVAIGSSTGGVEALRQVLVPLPPDAPGVVVVQHMPPGFTRSFADRLNGECAVIVKEAEEGDRVMPGRVLIAPGSHHLQVLRTGGEYRVTLDLGPKVDGHRPSATVLMHSMAKHVGKNGVGAILTGMGRDGAAGLLALRQAGGRTCAQDEASCVVYGMPKAAWESGAAQHRVPLHEMAAHILGAVVAA